MRKPPQFHTEITHDSRGYSPAPYRVALFKGCHELESNYCHTYSLAQATGEAMLRGAVMQARSSADPELSTFVLSGIKVT